MTAVVDSECAPEEPLWKRGPLASIRRGLRKAARRHGFPENAGCTARMTARFEPAPDDRVRTVAAGAVPGSVRQRSSEAAARKPGRHSAGRHQNRDSTRAVRIPGPGQPWPLGNTSLRRSPPTGAGAKVRPVDRLSWPIRGWPRCRGRLLRCTPVEWRTGPWCRNSRLGAQASAPGRRSPLDAGIRGPERRSANHPIAAAAFGEIQGGVC